MAVDMKTLARECIEELFDRGKIAYLQEVSELSFIGHDPVSAKSISLDDEKKIVESFRVGFPDLKASVSDIITEGNRAVCRWRMSGTHKGEFLGFAATGRRVAFDGITEMRFHDGRLAEQWTLYDCFGLLHQLDVLPELDSLSKAHPVVEESGAIHFSV